MTFVLRAKLRLCPGAGSAGRSVFAEGQRHRVSGSLAHLYLPPMVWVRLYVGHPGLRGAWKVT
ncbi:MAG TPA: hypothetical protein VGC70_09215 [Burkholderiales bacterium]